MNIIELLRRNGLFIVALAIMLICFLARFEHRTEAVVPNPDSVIEFSTNHTSMEQTWQANGKYLCSVTIPYTSKNDFSSDIQLSVIQTNTNQELVTSSTHVSFNSNTKDNIIFPLEITKIIPGEQYLFRVNYSNSQGEGTLLIPTGTNFDGGSIDVQPCNQGFALSLDLLKYTKIFWLFFVLFPLFAFSFFFMIVFDKGFEETIGISFVLTILVLYLFGLFRYLEMGILVLFVLSFIAFFIAIYLYNRKKMEIKQLLSPTLPIYLIAIILIILNCRGRFLARWDEYSHWGLAAKDMFYFNQFAWHLNSTVTLCRYPPFATLTEYFYEYGNGMFSQSILYVAYQMILLSSLFIAFKIVLKSKRMLIPVALFLFTIPIVMISDVYNCIYVDSLLAGWVAYVLICYWTDKQDCFNYLRILAGLIALTLTKDMGLILAAILCFFIFMDAIVSSYREKKIKFKMFGQSILGLAIVCIVFFGWQDFVNQPIQVSQLELDEFVNCVQNVETKELTTQDSISASGISIGNLLELIKGEAPGYRYKAIKKFFAAIFDSKTYIFGFIELSFIDTILLIMIITLIMGMVLNRKLKNNSYFIKSVYLLIGGFLYAIFLLITYLFAFSAQDALTMASHERYLASYLGGIILAFGVLLLWDYVKSMYYKKTTRVMAVAIVFLIMIFPVKNLVIQNRDISITEDQLYGFDELEKQCRSFGKKGDKICLICNDTANGFGLILRNHTSPMICDGFFNPYGTQESLEEDLTEENINNNTGCVMTVRELEKQLSEYQYVLVMHPSETFSESYGTLFEDENTIQNGTIYRVNLNTNQDIKLTLIGQTPIECLFSA